MKNYFNVHKNLNLIGFVSISFLLFHRADFLSVLSLLFFALSWWVSWCVVWKKGTRINYVANFFFLFSFLGGFFFCIQYFWDKPVNGMHYIFNYLYLILFLVFFFIAFFWFLREVKKIK